MSGPTVIGWTDPTFDPVVTIPLRAVAQLTNTATWYDIIELRKFFATAEQADLMSPYYEEQDLLLYLYQIRRPYPPFFVTPSAEYDPLINFDYNYADTAQYIHEEHLLMVPGFQALRLALRARNYPDMIAAIVLLNAAIPLATFSVETMLVHTGLIFV